MYFRVGDAVLIAGVRPVARRIVVRVDTVDRAPCLPCARIMRYMGLCVKYVVAVSVPMCMTVPGESTRADTVVRPYKRRNGHRQAS